MKNLIKISTFFLLHFLVFAKNGTSQAVSVSETPQQYVYLNFHIKKTAGNPKGEVELVSTKIVNGKFKQIGRASSIKKSIHFSIKNNSGRIISEVSIEDPLEEELEYIDGSGQLTRTVVQKEEADFSIKLPYSADCTEVKIMAGDGSEKIIPLFKSDK